MQSKHLTIIHGYTASPESHWFPWLEQQLKPQGVAVSRLAMPDADHPSPTTWVDYLNEKVTQHDQNSFFVAHSLGCITLLRHLETQDANKKIGGMILVAGFADALSLLPELDPFTRAPLKLDHLVQVAPQRTVLASRNDPIVPYPQSAALSRQLQAKLLTVANAGHFLGQDGFSQLPLVLEEVQAMMR